MKTKILVKLFLASTLVSFAALVGCNQVEEEDFPITINIDVEQGRSINADAITCIHSSRPTIAH